MNTPQPNPTRDFKSPEIWSAKSSVQDHGLTIRPRESEASLVAFTILEVSVVITLLLILASVAGAGFSRTRPSGQAVQCLSNLGRLACAWQMYAQDNNDKLLPAIEGLTFGGASDGWGPGWVNGWLDWSTSTDNTNIAYLIDERYARLAKYVNQRADIFKCPSDNYLSSNQRARGWTQRARSYSLNIGVGSRKAPWGDYRIYWQVTRISEFRYPAPRETWIFVNEHPASINDATFYNPNPSWVDLPATYHNGAAGFSFADGHSEMHKWTGSLRQLGNETLAFNPPLARAGDPDVHWMSFHSQRNSTNSF